MSGRSLPNLDELLESLTPRVREDFVREATAFFANRGIHLLVEPISMQVARSAPTELNGFELLQSQEDGVTVAPGPNATVVGAVQTEIARPMQSGPRPLSAAQAAAQRQNAVDPERISRAVTMLMRHERPGLEWPLADIMAGLRMDVPESAVVAILGDRRRRGRPRFISSTDNGTVYWRLNV